MKLDQTQNLIVLCKKHNITDTASLVKKLADESFKNSEDAKEISKILDHILDSSEYTAYKVG